MDDVIRQLADDIYRDRVRRARSMTFKQKFLAGGDLFDAACAVTAGGIRHTHPTFSNAQVLEELRRRLALRRNRTSFPSEYAP